MTKTPIPQRKRLAAIFASFAILLVGGLSLLENMTIDYYSVLGTLQKILPASIILGGLGWVMGMILDKPKKKVLKKYNNLYLKALAKEKLAELNAKAEENAQLKTETNEEKG